MKEREGLFAPSNEMPKRRGAALPRKGVGIVTRLGGGKEGGPRLPCPAGSKGESGLAASYGRVSGQGVTS